MAELLNNSFVSYTILGHLLKKIEITSPDVCEVNCFIEPDCVSFNVGPLQDGKHWCELSNSDHLLHPKDLVYRVGVTYVSFKVREKILSAIKINSRFLFQMELW